jgi:hypothetical protein
LWQQISRFMFKNQALFAKSKTFRIKPKKCQYIGAFYNFIRKQIHLRKQERS